MDILKRLDNCIFKVKLMKKYMQRDLRRMDDLENNLKLIKTHRGGYDIKNENQQKE